MLLRLALSVLPLLIASARAAEWTAHQQVQHRSFCDSPPRPMGDGGFTRLNGVDCASPTDCWAVGFNNVLGSPQQR
jgi:hypothetical protein